MNARRKISADVTPVTKAAARAEEEAPASSYFASGDSKSNIDFISSGAAVVDCALGGGYAGGRVVNIVGDRSAGKTLLAMEAATNFIFKNLKKYPKVKVRYDESEAAFDEAYAAALGVPVAHIWFNERAAPTETVEDMHANLEAYITWCEKEEMPGLYIIDSLDALSDEAEMARDIGDASYGGSKPKKIGEMFRRLVRRMEAANVTMIVVSQIRDKLNVTFGETKTRSGGKALDFYATHIIWIVEIGKLKRTVRGEERVIGIEVEMNVKKNKVGPAFRRARYNVMFGYGIDDMMASADWLCAVSREKRLAELGMRKSESSRAKTKVEAAAPKAKVDTSLAGYKDLLGSLRDKGGDEARTMRAKLTAIVKEEWAVIEMDLLPKATKY